MMVGEARELARRWVREVGQGAAGFVGALTHGSSNWLPADAVLPATSDFDLLLVLDGPPADKLGKLRYEGLLLEVSSLAADELAAPERVLGVPHLAGNVARATLLADPTGRLAAVQAEVARQYPLRRWVRARCEAVRAKSLAYLHGRDPAAPRHQQVMAWAFAAGLTTHVVLAAGLANLTVRRRYEALAELLAAYGRSDAYEPFLELLGCAGWSAATVERHLAALGPAFDAAAAVITTPTPWAADLAPEARPVAVDSGWELVRAGRPREAVFWLVVAAARCRQVLCQDARETVAARFEPGWRELLTDLGVATVAELDARAAQLEAKLPWVAELAEAVMAANPDVIG